MPYKYSDDRLTCILETHQCEYSGGCKRRVAVGLPFCWQHSRKQYGVKAVGRGASKTLESLREITVGEWVAPFGGKLVSTAELTSLYESGDLGPFASDLTEVDSVNAACVRGIGSMARLGQHGNVELVIRSNRTPWLRSIRSISAGDEIVRRPEGDTTRRSSNTKYVSPKELKRQQDRAKRKSPSPPKPSSPRPPSPRPPSPRQPSPRPPSPRQPSPRPPSPKYPSPRPPSPRQPVPASPRISFISFPNSSQKPTPPTFPKSSSGVTLIGTDLLDLCKFKSHDNVEIFPAVTKQGNQFVFEPPLPGNAIHMGRSIDSSGNFSNILLGKYIVGDSKKLNFAPKYTESSNRNEVPVLMKSSNGETTLQEDKDEMWIYTKVFCTMRDGGFRALMEIKEFELATKMAKIPKPYFGATIYATKRIIGMEILDNVVFSDYVIRLTDRQKTFDFCKDIFMQVASALWFLQKNIKLVHGDFHAGNIMMKRSGTYSAQAYIIDFGMSRTGDSPVAGYRHNMIPSKFNPSIDLLTLTTHLAEHCAYNNKYTLVNLCKHFADPFWNDVKSAVDSTIRREKPTFKFNTMNVVRRKLVDMSAPKKNKIQVSHHFLYVNASNIMYDKTKPKQFLAELKNMKLNITQKDEQFKKFL